jgi:uncharacterized protein YhjY with autotransporter beta-barrel domain
LGTKQKNKNKIHNKNPTSGVNDTDNIGNKTEKQKQKTQQEPHIGGERNRQHWEQNRKTKQNTQQEPHIGGERHRQHWEQNRKQKNKTKYTTRTPHRG